MSMIKAATKLLAGVTACSLVLIGAMGSVLAADPKIRIAFPSGMNGQITVAMDKAKIAAKHGLDAEFVPFQYGPPMMEALASGSVDAVVTSLMPVTSFSSKLPGSAKIVAALGNSTHSLMVGKGSPIAKADELKGKKLGVSFGSDSHLDTLIWIEAQGIKDDVSLVNIPPAELATALGNGSVDAIVIRQPQVLRLKETSGAKVLHTWPFRFFSIMRSKFIEENPSVIEKYVAALQEAMFYVAENKEQASIWFGEHLRMDPKIIRAVSEDDPNYNVTALNDIDVAVGDKSKTLLLKWFDDALKYGMIKKPVDPKLVF